MIEIKPTSFAALHQNKAFMALVHEYNVECSLVGMPRFDEKLSTYHAIDGSEFFHAFMAVDDGELVGFMFILTPVIPHYGYAIATTESLFVGTTYRKSGAGMALIRFAYAFAKSVGSPAIAISSPSGGRLQSILPKMGFRETNRIYLKEVDRG